jgi:hypothetical protein
MLMTLIQWGEKQRYHYKNTEALSEASKEAGLESESREK